MGLIRGTTRSQAKPLIRARSTARDVLAFGADLAARDAHVLPGPARARAARAQDIDIRGRAGDCSCDPVQSEVRDRDAVRRGAGRAAVLVVLLDDDAVDGDAAELDVAVDDAGDGAGRAVDGLDADPVLAVADGAVFDRDVRDGVVGAAADGAEAQAVAATAGPAVKVMLVPKLMAMQSSWFLTVMPDR